jgi:hypothetical protein
MQTVLSAIVLLLAMETVSALGFRVFMVLAAGSIVSALMHWGWLMPCMVFGCLVGATLDPPAKGGSLDGQIIETACYLIGGAITGLVIGLVLDRFQLQRGRDKARTSISRQAES